MKVKVLGSNGKNIPRIAKQFAKEYLEYYETHGNPVVVFTLSGSHSKALHNEGSDLDIVLYYVRSLHNLISLAPRTPSLRSDFPYEVVSKDGTTAYLYNEVEVELISRPLYSIGAYAGKQLFPQLVNQNGKDVHDILKDYVIYSDKEWGKYWGKLKKFMLKKYNYATYNLMGYFKGYMKSQLLRHRRRQDFKLRENKALKEDIVDPVVKNIVEGVYIGLSGCLFVEKAIVTRDFRILLKEYGDRFSEEHVEFIEMLYRHKTGKEEITENTVAFVLRARNLREEIYHQIYELQKEAENNSVFPYKLSNSQQEENISGLNEILREIYGLDGRLSISPRRREPMVGDGCCGYKEPVVGGGCCGHQV